MPTAHVLLQLRSTLDYYYGLKLYMHARISFMKQAATRGATPHQATSCCKRSCSLHGNLQAQHIPLCLKLCPDTDGFQSVAQLDSRLGACTVHKPP
jgi:hypothetical protein